MKNTLKVQRAIKNLTQADLAEKAGVTRQTINSIELGKYVPTTVLSLKLAKVLGKPVEELFSIGKRRLSKNTAGGKKEVNRAFTQTLYDRSFFPLLSMLHRKVYSIGLCV